ncbi:hypothetical protein [Zhongshania sp.]|uniref:hypothetical protein n=1 Tax=Zhongshania sp. TaxID=1971902 RepID=UPI0035683CC5
MILIPSLLIRRTLAIALCFAATVGHAATPLSDLYSAVPRPPADVTEALTWVNEGEIVQAKFVAVAAALAAERAKIATLNGGATPSIPISVATSIPDSVEVQAAARSFADYLAHAQGDAAPKAVLGKRKRWLQAAFGSSQLEISRSMAPCDTPCTDTAVIEANKRLVSRRNYELKTELRAWNAMFDDWKTKQFGVLIAGDAHIEAAGGAATTAQGRSIMASYQAAMLDEIELLLSITKLCVLRAEAIVKGLDGSEPDAISGATKKAAK